MIKGVHHIGIAVNNLEEARKLYRDVYGFKVGANEVNEKRGIRIAWAMAGNTKFELMEPLNPQSELAQQIAKRGEGMHHLALLVDDMQQAIATLKKKGVPLVSDTPGTGYGGTKTLWLHPKGTCKALTELVQE